MLTTLLHFCLPYLAAADASSPPSGEVAHFLATVQAVQRMPPLRSHLHSKGPQGYFRAQTTRQGWRGGWDLTRRVRSSCNGGIFGQLPISPAKAGQSML